MAWGSVALALTCLGVALLHLVRLAVLRRNVAGEASYAAMGLGMAAMAASPLGIAPVPEPMWAAVFLVVAAWFAVPALRTGEIGGEPFHHLVASAAMVFMVTVGLPSGHVHDSASDVPGFVPLIAIVLAGYFGWHALRCADRCRSHPREPGGGAVALRALAVRTPRAAAVGNLVQAVAMTSMLMTML